MVILSNDETGVGKIIKLLTQQIGLRRPIVARLRASLRVKTNSFNQFFKSSFLSPLTHKRIAITLIQFTNLIAAKSLFIHFQNRS